jgi:quercetin dioxygenase-like cupin family protein
MNVERLEEGDTVEAVPSAHLTQLADGERMSVQHFRIEPGAVVPSHSHPHEQAGYIFQGEFTFLLGDAEDPEEVVVGPGDGYVLAGEEVHGAENRGEETVLGVDVFSPPRTDPDWAE